MYRSTHLPFLAAALVLLAAGGLSRAVAAADGPLVWPNARSRANSDDWLVKNHDRITQMRPRLLVLNFVNGLKPEEARGKVDRLIAALRESSRFHGYNQPDAKPFLEYQVDKLVD